MKMEDQSDMQEKFDRSCRICAEEQEVGIMLFSKEAEALLLRNKIVKYLQFDVVHNDRLPKMICIKCCSRLDGVSDFIETAHKSQDFLQMQLKTIDLLCGNNTSIAPTSPAKNEVTLTQYTDNDYTTCPPARSPVTEMEVSLDPMIVLQYSGSNEDMYSDEEENDKMNYGTNLSYMHGLENEDVTIQLIKQPNNAEPNHESNIRKVSSVDARIAYSNEKLDGKLEDTTNKKPFPCKVCKRGFLTELALKNHSWIHTRPPELKAYGSCPICSVEVSTKQDLSTHLRVHRDRVTCTICSRMFKSPKNLALHMESHTNHKQAYPCHICGRVYNTSSNLRTHSITHSTDRPYRCPTCSKTFKRNQDLKFHINQHTGDRPYGCPYCSKRFASSGNCYSHRYRMHPEKVQKRYKKAQILSNVDDEKERPHGCNYCSSRFKKKEHLLYHTYQHTGEKPYKCTYCPQAFISRAGWWTHHRVEHPDQEKPVALISESPDAQEESQE